MIVVAEYIIFVNTDELGVFAQMPLGENRCAKRRKIIAFQGTHFGLVDVQFLGYLDGRYLLGPSGLGQPFAAYRTRGLVGRFLVARSILFGVHP